MRNSLDLWRGHSPWFLFDEGDNFVDRDQRNFAPAVEVDEKEDHFFVSADLPGVNKDNVKVEVHDGVLTISGERHQETKKSKEGRSEKFYGHFERTFTLPTNVDADKIEARYENGVLELAIPKAEEAKAKPIHIQSGKEGFLGRFLGRKDSTKEASEKAS